MTIAILKTRAETALADEFERVVDRLPGGPEVAEFRRKAFAVFAERGLPHRRIEAWKYTDLRTAMKEALPLAIADATPVTARELAAALGPLASLDVTRCVLVNGHWSAALSSPDLQGKSLDILPLAPAMKVDPAAAAVRFVQAAGPNDDSIVALNTALATDGVAIDVKASPQRPILIVHVVAGGKAQLAVTRTTIAVRPQAQATVIEVHVTLPGASPGQTNTATEVAVGDGASLDHVKVTLGGAVHLATWAPTLAANGTYRAFHLTANSHLVRNQVFATFAGPGGKLDISGAFLARGTEHVDTTLVIDHAVPGCQSRELFKGVLDGHARGVFQGKVIVRPYAQKSDGKQMAQVLMLSADAEFDSKPELEIYADDVVCGHGSTAAEIDADLLFYCRSRGIPLAEARALLIASFVGEALAKVEDERVRAALTAIAAAWLQRPTVG